MRVGSRVCGNGEKLDDDRRVGAACGSVIKVLPGNRRWVLVLMKILF